MSDTAGTETVAQAAAAQAHGAKEVNAAAASMRTPFVDGLGPILLGVLWALGPSLYALFHPMLIAPGQEWLNPAGAALLIDETRSTVMQKGGIAVLLFAGLARASAPWATGRDALALRGLGKLAFVLLCVSVLAWVGLSVSFLAPGLWSNPWQGESFRDLTLTIPPEVYWADFTVLAAFYAAMALFALQILATVLAGFWSTGSKVGPAALAFAIAAGLALFALPDDLRHNWNELTTPVSAPNEIEETAEGLAAKAIARADGRYYVYDQIQPNALDFIAIAAALGVLLIAVWRATGGARGWPWLASLGVAVFGVGALFTLSNIGLAAPQAMARALIVASVTNFAPLFLLPIAWVGALAAKKTLRGAPAFWALAALLPSAAAVFAVPAIAWGIEDVQDGFDLWRAAFDTLDVALLSFAGFAGWYALQHQLTGRETGRFWSVAHLIVALLVSGGAVLGAYYSLYLGVLLEFAIAPLPQAAQEGVVLSVFGAEYAIFLLGLVLARRRPYSRFEPLSSDALGAASRAASAAKPKESFKKTTLFGEQAAGEVDAKPDASTPVGETAQETAQETGQETGQETKLETTDKAPPEPPKDDAALEAAPMTQDASEPPETVAETAPESTAEPAAPVETQPEAPTAPAQSESPQTDSAQSEPTQAVPVEEAVTPQGAAPAAESDEATQEPGDDAAEKKPEAE